MAELPPFCGLYLLRAWPTEPRVPVAQMPAPRGLPEHIPFSAGLGKGKGFLLLYQWKRPAVPSVVHVILRINTSSATALAVAVGRAAVEFGVQTQLLSGDEEELDWGSPPANTEPICSHEDHDQGRSMEKYGGISSSPGFDQ